MGVIDRYILRSVATPLILALCVAAMLLLLEQMLRLFDFVLAEQGPVTVVWRMLGNLLPHYFGLALPLGTFLGILLAFRNLSLSSEIDALNSSGASFGRLMRPIYGLVFGLMVFDFLLVGYIQPYAQYQYKEIRFDVTNGAFGIKIPQSEFVDLSPTTTVRLGEINSGTRRARDIFLERLTKDGTRTVITARSGSISASPDLTTLLMELSEGRQLFIDEAGATLRSLEFDNFDIEIDLPAIGVFRPRGRDHEEATFSELHQFLKTQPARSSEKWYEYRAGFHWSIIHPLTFLIMPILGVAMGVTGRRKANPVRPILGVAILIIYHELLEEWGQVIAAEGKLSPFISMWGLLLLFALISGFLYIGSIDKARTAQVMTRQARKTIRVREDGGLEDDGSALTAGSVTK